MLLEARTRAPNSPRALGIPFRSGLVPCADRWAPGKLVSRQEKEPACPSLEAECDGVLAHVQLG